MVKFSILDSGRRLASSDNLRTYRENHKCLLLCSSEASYAFHSCTSDLSEAVIYQSLRKEFELRVTWPVM